MSPKGVNGEAYYLSIYHNLFAGLNVDGAGL